MAERFISMNREASFRSLTQVPYEFLPDRMLVVRFRVQSASINFYLPSAQRFLSVVRDSRRTGAVAQLGERLICIQEVAGSIPTSSTRNAGVRRQVLLLGNRPVVLGL